MKECINKGCREAVSQPQVSGRGREVVAAVVVVLAAGGLNRLDISGCVPSAVAQPRIRLHMSLGAA